MDAYSDKVVRVIDSSINCPEIPLVEGQGNAKVILWPGNGAEFRSMQLFSLHKGDQSVALKHVNDCVYYVVAGAGLIEGLESGNREELVEGSVVHIDANDEYRIIAGDSGIKFLGGPCPPDADLYAGLKTSGAN